MIRPHELAGIRQTVREHLDRAGHWYEPTESRSGSGGVIKTYPSTPTRATPVRLAPMDKKIEAMYAERLGGRQGFTITAPHGTPVRTVARVKVDGRTFEVLGSDSGMSFSGGVRVPVVELT